MLVRSEIDRIAQVKDMIRAPYAFPGGYRKVLITADGACLCSDCVKKEFKLIAQESFDNSNCGFRAFGVDVNWENSELYCDHCGNRLPPEYGED